MLHENVIDFLGAHYYTLGPFPEGHAEQALARVLCYQSLSASQFHTDIHNMIASQQMEGLSNPQTIVPISYIENRPLNWKHVAKK